MDHNQTAETRIIDLYFARSEEAIAETAACYGAYCKKIAGSILCSDEDTEECVNDTWLKAWDSIPPNRPHNLKAYLAKITRNLAIHRREKERAEKRGGGEVPLVLSELAECVPDTSSAEDGFSKNALTDALDRFLGGLSREKRVVFLRRYWYNASVAEIARDMGLSESKVKSILHRLRSQLKLLLEKEGIL
ncbi:MAG: sigma-70 family RNA polymerase sigma factor [Clostridia bacterium]|nr:sigma-70 family RNA polymerase sigma factor [Clostridia bacterium]